MSVQPANKTKPTKNLLRAPRLPPHLRAPRVKQNIPLAHTGLTVPPQLVAQAHNTCETRGTHTGGSGIGIQATKACGRSTGTEVKSEGRRHLLVQPSSKPPAAASIPLRGNQPQLASTRGASSTRTHEGVPIWVVRVWKEADDAWSKEGPSCCPWALRALPLRPLGRLSPFLAALLGAPLRLLAQLLVASECPS